MVVDLNEENSFEQKLAHIKKKSIDLKKKAIEHISFNNSEFFSKEHLSRVEEESPSQMLVKDISFIDNSNNDSSNRLIHPV